MLTDEEHIQDKLEGREEYVDKDTGLKGAPCRNG